jgi:Bacterial Ig-like domain (group 3)
LKIRLRSVLVGAAALAVATSVLVGGGAAFAATTPGWEPDPDSIGTVTFYNATGQVITGGNLADAPMVAYAAASGPGRTGDNKATLEVFTPKLGLLPSAFTGDFLSASTNYPNASAPAPVKNLTVPVASTQAGDQSLGTYIGGNPNTETTAGWAGLYEVRLVTSGPGIGLNPKYFRTDILVTGNTWSVAFPAAATATATSTPAATPPSPAAHGQTVTLSSTVTPANTPGSVHFFDGATDLGAATYNQATGVATLAVNPADGNHSFTAQFTPTDTTAFTGSTSAALSYTVTPPGTPTTTTLSANPPSGTAAGAGGTLSVALTANVTPLGTAGSVHFFDGATDLGAGTYNAATGVATLTSSLATGTHPLIATFTPSATGFQPSSSAVLNYAVVGANSAAVPLDAVDNTAPFAGTVSLQVATGTAVHLVQLDPTTAAGHPVQATDPTGHRHAWVFQGSLTGVSVNDTRPAENGWTVNGTASQFQNGTTVIPATNLGWSPALVAAGSDAEGTVTAGSSVASHLADATSNGLSASRGLAVTAAGNGLGTQNLSASLELRIPDTSPTGTYSSILTLTLVSP